MQGRKLSGVLRLEKYLRKALPGHCAFCLGKPEGNVPWCQACFDRLPWNRRCCTRCAEPLKASQASLCQHCQREPPAFTAAHVPFLYQAPIRQMVHEFKFAASPRSGHLLVALFLQSLCGHGRAEWQADVLVPVPLYPRRARERGFNQADWLARQLGHHLDLPVVKATRIMDTPSQRLLGRQGRRDNLIDAFQLGLPSAARVVIVDDVVTTGSTAHALAKAAFAAGAQHVSIVAFARTPLGQE